LAAVPGILQCFSRVQFLLSFILQGVADMEMKREKALQVSVILALAWTVSSARAEELSDSLELSKVPRGTYLRLFDGSIKPKAPGGKVQYKVHPRMTALVISNNRVTGGILLDEHGQEIHNGDTRPGGEVPGCRILFDPIESGSFEQEEEIELNGKDFSLWVQHDYEGGGKEALYPVSGTEHGSRIKGIFCSTGSKDIPVTLGTLRAHLGALLRTVQPPAKYDASALASWMSDLSKQMRAERHGAAQVSNQKKKSVKPVEASDQGPVDFAGPNAGKALSGG